MTDMASSAAVAGGSNNNSAANGPGGGVGHNEPFDRKKEMAEYEAEKKIIKDAIAKRAKILAELSHVENKIADLEGRYLESTPGGNILTGFDNYTKGLTGAAAQRRKVGNAEQNRVFSRSSVSYNALNQEAPTPISGTSTPGAPTPVSTSFGGNKDKGGASEAATPTSTTEKKTLVNKKKKEKATTADDSETDSKADGKKARAHFGANARK